MNIDVIFKVAAVGMIVAVLNQVLSRFGKDEYTMLTTLAGVILVLMMVIPYISQLFQTVRTVFGL